MHENLSAWISKAQEKGLVPVLTHRNGDMDTVGSAIALASTSPRLMACGKHLGRTAKQLVEELHAPFKILGNQTQWPENIGGLIVVDSAGPDQVGMNLPQDIPICIIDHHATTEWNLREDDFDGRVPMRSTTQIIFEYLKNQHHECLTDSVRKMLLAGLITDTGRFRHADKDALRCAAELMDGAEFEYQSFVESIENVVYSSSDTGAMLSAFRRSKSIEVGNLRLIHTNCGTLEGRVCSSLIGIGADVAMAVRHRDRTTRITARASRKATKSGVHLGMMLQKLAKEVGGEGGGHDGAAGWTSHLDPVAAESAFINALAKWRQMDE